jgi:hypothetical protein
MDQIILIRIFLVGRIFRVWQNNGINNVNHTLNIFYVGNNDIGTTESDTTFEQNVENNLVFIYYIQDEEGK